MKQITHAVDEHEARLAPGKRDLQQVVVKVSPKPGPLLFGFPSL